MKVKIEFEVSKKLFDHALSMPPKGSLKIALKDSIRSEFNPWNKKAIKNFSIKVSK